MLCLAAKKMCWRPMMIFGANFATNLANKWKLPWMELLNFNTSSFNKPAFGEAGCSVPTSSANERIFWLATGVGIKPDTPAEATAVLTGMFRIFDFIFPRGICHETMPVLRQ